MNGSIGCAVAAANNGYPGMVATADTTSPEVEAYLRQRTGLSASTLGWPWLRRVLSYRWTWTSVAVVTLATVSIFVLITDIMRTRTAQDGSKIPGLNADALMMAANRAWPTMVFWIVCFILVDRYKPQRFLVWLLALTWGACVAVTGSYYINSWAETKMAVVDPMSGASAVRVAVFVAPFVEEATKACVIFLIVALDRNRFASRISGAIVGGLAGAGFAFTENIVYYARVIVYGSYTSGAGDVMEQLDEIVLLRGVLTCFGHPMFTLATGVGIGFAVTSRSKVVRVMAPVSGYLLAAFLHMFFNWWVSVLPSEMIITILMIGVWPIVAVVAIRVTVSSIRQGRTVADRLTDYVAMGWLPSNYPSAMSRLRTRVWTILMSLWHAKPVLTWLLQVRATELALLREAITRGTIDRGGLWREYELIDEIARLGRRGGLADGRGMRPYWPWNSRRSRGVIASARRVAATPRQNAVSEPVLKYSVVDAGWKPPA